ncbi:outer membrane protein assembly factor BamA [Desulfovibrio inopinatus]|uniref:outer membrane protein assembly factor BamA n=1 Tax=Desulfovibrio inopinatus TaxID=102109 RepID=UPI00041B2A76|nr:outer membrane protein assembly factor BamA [Desulfovibrio inopinatus]
MGRPNVLSVLVCFFLAMIVALHSNPVSAQDEAPTKVVILPFAVNAPGKTSAIAKSLPALLADQLRSNGVSVVVAANAPNGTSKALSQNQASKAARSAGAGMAVYGSFNQVGESISLDAEVLKLSSGKAVPIVVTKKGLINLQPAVAEAADTIAAMALPGGRIVEIDVEGNDILDKDVVLLKIKSQVGDRYDPRQVNDDLKRLYKLGYFDDVQVRTEDIAGGTKLIFVVSEKPRIQAISVIGAGDIDKDDILEVMNTKTGSVLNLDVLADDLNKIRDLYRKEGYYKVDVTYELEAADARRARLNIVVRDAKKLYITNITIEGAKQIDPDDLKSELSLSERDFLSWILGTGVLKEELLERDAAAIEAYYANRGFVDARVGQPRVDIADDGIHITFPVQEGERYRVGSVAFRGDLLEEDKAFMEYIHFDELSDDGSFFDRSVLRDDINMLTELYADYGYAFADIDVELEKNEAEKKINITYVIDKGRKVYIRRVLIEGNEKTRDNVIRRELKLADGQMFSGSKLRRSNERLEKLDFFEKIDIEPVPTDNPAEVDMLVKVKDKNTGSIAVGAGYSTSDSVFVGGTITERNLFGKGYSARFGGMFSGRTQRFQFNFTNPRLYDSDLTVGLDLYNHYRKFDDYKKDTVGGALRFAYPVGEYTMLDLVYRLDWYNIYDTNPYASSVIVESSGEHWSSSLYLAATRDTTDSATKPTKGTINELSFQFAGGVLGGDDAFIKPGFTSNFFYPLFWDSVFHWKGHAAAIFDNTSGSIPVYERFYLGGIKTVRGYEADKISPRDPWTGERIGGTREFYTNFEWIFNISKTHGVQGVTFFDMGSAWDDNDGFDLYKGVGVGLRWYSPMGLFRVEYGYGLDADRHNMEPHQIGFTVGQSF